MLMSGEIFVMDCASQLRCTWMNQSKLHLKATAVYVFNSVDAGDLAVLGALAIRSFSVPFSNTELPLLVRESSQLSPQYRYD